MRWIEEIRVRTKPQKGEEVLENLLETARAAQWNKQLKTVRVFSHYFAPGGFSLILFWDTASLPMEGSDTAMLILEGLKPLGLIDYTVMIEEGKEEIIHF